MQNKGLQIGVLQLGAFSPFTCLKCQSALLKGKSFPEFFLVVRQFLGGVRQISFFPVWQGLTLWICCLFSNWCGLSRQAFGLLPIL